MKLITLNIDTIKSLCDKYHVKTLFAFGSVTRDELKPSSDIDLVVDFAAINLYDYADNYFDLKISLEKLFQRPVDLLEDKAIKNPFLRKSIDSSKQIVYGR